MNINDLAIPERGNATIDTDKNRVELILDGNDDQMIVGYYPSNSLQVYVYKVNGRQIPDMWDLGLRTEISGRCFRTLICRHGHGEFTENGVCQNLSGGEFCLKYGQKDENRFSFTADSLIGVEIVLQVDAAVEESVLLRMLRGALRHMGLSKDDFQMDQWYFSNFSKESEKAVDRLIENCFNGSDSALILINAAEVGYNLGNDYNETDPKERKYPTNLQRAIAEDMHRQLTENYCERITAAMFAEKYGLSDSTVKNYFKTVYGYSFKEYQMKVRMEKAAELLIETDLKLVAIAMAVGYATQAKFISAFKKHYQMTPSEYRRRKRLEYILDTTLDVSSTI